MGPSPVTGNTLRSLEASLTALVDKFMLQLMNDLLVERQDLVSSSLGLGLLLSAFGAAVVGSLVAVGVTRLSNIRVREAAIH